MSRNMQWIVAALLIAVILAAPTETGEAGRGLVSWVASGWDPAVDFLDALVNEDESP